jgi:vacuolar protein sorting-associated protein 18
LKPLHDSAMALDIDAGYVAPNLGAGSAVETTLPIFNVERVQLQFNIASDFVAGQVANNVLILALATGRILRIDLESPSDIDGLSARMKPLH